MSYKQIKSFDQGAAGKIKGYCLQNTRKGFGIASKHANAWQAWLNTDQHTDAIPADVDVPVYFWYKGEENGHIGVRLANGRFWSDGNIYASIEAYNAAGHTPQYRGWSTSINGVKVIEYVADPKPVGQSVFLPSSAGKWRLYDEGVAPVKGNEKTFLRPDKFSPGLIYVIVRYADGGATAVIDTKQFGRGKVYIKGTSAQIR